MKLHTSLTGTEVRDCLRVAKAAGLVTPDIEFSEFSERGSRTHDRSFGIQLGTYDKDSLPRGTKDQHGSNLRVRRYKNSGSYGAGQLWAATWHEWGWFIAEIMRRDPQAVFGGYQGAEGFHARTGRKFETRNNQPV